MPEPLHLASLRMALQPVVDLESGEVVGHEALVRGPCGSPWREPATLMERTRGEDREEELEVACRSLAVAAGRERLPTGQRLFLNVDIRYAHLPIDASPLPLDPARVVIEVSERQSVLESPEALKALQRWRNQGYAVVLDDYGTGHAALGALLALQPDMIKVDRYIIEGVDREARHQRALAALLDLADDLGTALVAEGIETEEELRTLRAMGVQLGQGFLLGPPAAAAALRCPEHLMMRTAPPARVRATPPPPAAHTAIFHDTMFDSLEDGAYYVDRRRTILRWNRAAEAITGFAAAEVVGRRCMASRLGHVSADGRPLCHGGCPLVHTMADGQARRETIRLRRKDGHEVTVTVRTAPVRAPDGHVIGAVELFSDSDDPWSGTA